MAQLISAQAQKFTVGADDDDDELEEEGILESPLDKIEPYSMFKHALFRMLPRHGPRLFPDTGPTWTIPLLTSYQQMLTGCSPSTTTACAVRKLDDQTWS